MIQLNLTLLKVTTAQVDSFTVNNNSPIQDYVYLDDDDDDDVAIGDKMS